MTVAEENIISTLRRLVASPRDSGLWNLVLSYWEKKATNYCSL